VTVHGAYSLAFQFPGFLKGGGVVEYNAGFLGEVDPGGGSEQVFHLGIQTITFEKDVEGS
jgi:hypothetical protein